MTRIYSSSICVQASEHQHPRLVYHERRDPGHRALGQDNAGRPLAAKLPLDGCHGRHAGGIEKAEGQKGCGCHRRERRRQGLRAPEEDGDGRHHALLGHKAADKGGGHPPVAKAHGREDRGDYAGEHGQNAVPGVLHDAKVQVKGLQEPDDNRRHKDDCEGSLQEP